MATQPYNLEERLLEYAAMIMRLVKNLPKTQAGNHIVGQLVRSRTSSLPNHGETEIAESLNDFIHKQPVRLASRTAHPPRRRRWPRFAIPGRIGGSRFGTESENFVRGSGGVTLSLFKSNEVAPRRGMGQSPALLFWQSPPEHEVALTHRSEKHPTLKATNKCGSTCCLTHAKNSQTPSRKTFHSDE
jgi:hypothetical protein